MGCRRRTRQRVQLDVALPLVPADPARYPTAFNGLACLIYDGDE